MVENIVVVQHMACETAGEMEPALLAVGAVVQTVRVFAGEPVPKTLPPHAGLVIMGGPMSVNDRDRLPYLRHELSLIEAALEAKRPILGVCLGSQLLATALGAKVYAGPAKEIGWHDVTLTDAGREDRVLGRLPPRFAALHWHEEVFDLPADCTLLATSQQTQHQAFRYRENAYGLLFHLEATETTLRSMTQAFADELREEGLDGAAICQDAKPILPTLRDHAHAVVRAWAASA